jgi:hypothetical protein
MIASSPTNRSSIQAVNASSVVVVCNVADVDAIMIEIEVERGRLAVAEGE